MTLTGALDLDHGSRPDPSRSARADRPFEVAVAEVVAQSIEAGAAHVHVRFVVSGRNIQSLYLVDDGVGMTPRQLDVDPGETNTSTGGDQVEGPLLRLNRAAFSQAQSVTVCTVTALTPALGRRWLASKGGSSEGDIVGSAESARELARSWGFPQATGTTVRWDDVRALSGAANEAAFSQNLQELAIRLRHHLGMIFHRSLSQARLTIGIDVEFANLGDTERPVQVQALDPFGYLRRGAPGFPQELTFSYGNHLVTASCHIWPGRSQQPQFLLPNGTPEQFQGIFLYCDDRMVQAGGWNALGLQSKELQLARVAIDLTAALRADPSFQFRVEQDVVHCDPGFWPALAGATGDDGATFAAFLNTARQTYSKAHSRNRSRPQVIPLGRGVPLPLKRTVERELDPLPGRDPVDLRWRDFTDELFFDIDRDSNAVWLNSRYRQALGGSTRYSFNDAPLVKTLLFLLVENLFHNPLWGSMDKDKLELWQTLLTAAAKEHLDPGGRDEPAN